MKNTLSVLWIAGLLAVSNCSAEADADVLQLSPLEARVKAEADEILIVDVRTPEEWRKTGVADGAERIEIKDPDFISKVMALKNANEGKDIAFICRSGNRSMKAARLLGQQVDSPVYNITEGMVGRTKEDGWIARGLPSETCCS